MQSVEGHRFPRRRESNLAFAILQFAPSDPNRLRIEPRHHLEAVELGGGEDVVFQAQHHQILPAEALAQLRGQPVRPERLGAEGLRQGKGGSQVSRAVIAWAFCW